MHSIYRDKKIENYKRSESDLQAKYELFIKYLDKLKKEGYVIPKHIYNTDAFSLHSSCKEYARKCQLPPSLVFNKHRSKKRRVCVVLLFNDYTLTYTVLYEILQGCKKEKINHILIVSEKPASDLSSFKCMGITIDR